LRTSKDRVRRLMRENALSAATRVGRARGPRAHDGTIIPETVATMWGTDIAAAFTTEHGQVVFIAVDHCSAECVGLHAAPRGTRFEALEPIRQGTVERFGGVARGVAQGLSIRHDHGSQCMAHDFRKEIGWRGATSSGACGPVSNVVEIGTTRSPAGPGLRFHAARSMDVAARGAASVSHPSTLRIVIWPEASSAQTSMSAVSASGGTALGS
jgi:hypothetical protein